MNLRDSMCRKKRLGQVVVSLTAYDYVFARMLDELGLDFLLVGDSVGMVQLGLKDTVDVTIEDMIHHARAVARGASATKLVVDLPAGSYATPEQARESALRLVDAGAHAVKLEGGKAVLPQVEAILRAEVAVVGHLGMLPQHVRVEGGYSEKGNSPEEASRLVSEAKLLDEVGVSAIIAELVQEDVAKLMSAAAECAIIGIGSGSQCDGQILVTHDLVGLFPWFRPRFVTPTGDLAGHFRSAVEEYLSQLKVSHGS